MEIKCIFNIGKKYCYISQGYSGERCGPWASCLKIFFSRTRRPISVKLSTNYLSIKGIQVVQIKGQVLFKMGWGHLKIFSITTSQFNQTCHNSSLGEGILVCSNKGDSPYSRGDIAKE
jgi:hypothetical protein